MCVRFPGRLQLVKGNSTESIPQFAHRYPNTKCDLVFIDGDHSLDVPLLDIQSIREISHSNTLIFMDDVRCAEDSYWCKHPTDAWVKSIHQGSLGKIRSFGWACSELKKFHLDGQIVSFLPPRENCIVINYPILFQTT